MKELLILSIILISLCVSNVQQASVIMEDTTETDIFVKAEAAPSQVESGRSLDIVFDIQNKRPDSITNVTLFVFDQCLFSGEDTKTFSEIRANASKRWSWKWNTSSVSFTRDCVIGFKVDYNANFSRTQTIPVLTESEYNLREAAGTLGSISSATSSSSNPIDILLSFSQVLPLIENDEPSIFIDYVNKEKGFIDKFNAGDIEITTTRNMENIDCNDYGLNDIEGVGDKLVLNRDLKFLGGRASRSTCTFVSTISTSSPIDSQVLTLRANYKYSLDYSLTVKVSPK